jgi:hypothetical protein
VKVPEEFAREFAEFPATLRKLVEAELKSGNRIVSIEHGFPAAPCGASIKLARAVNARRRKSGKGLSFYERNDPDYAGEFTTEERHFFVLEPPPPRQPEPDMNSLRAEREARQRAADEALYAAQLKNQTRARKSARNAVREMESSPPLPVPSTPPRPVAPRTLVERFRESMICNYERWHDGIGYDLELLKAATPEELVEIENLLVSQPVGDWRDVEALAALNSPRAQVRLRQALGSSNPEVATAVARYAPGLISDVERTAMLVKALERVEAFGGLSPTLAQVEQFHPPEVVEALLRGVQTRDGGTAVHFAAMLMFIYGKATSSFDWEQRPFFLRFNTEDLAERSAAYNELCSRIGVSASPTRTAPRS